MDPGEVSQYSDWKSEELFLISKRARVYSLLQVTQTSSVAYPSSYLISIQLTTHSHLVLKFIICRDIPSFPTRLHGVSIRITLPFTGFPIHLLQIYSYFCKVIHYKPQNVWFVCCRYPVPIFCKMSHFSNIYEVKFEIHTTQGLYWTSPANF